jgi:protein-disulfide isomerase
MTGLQFTSSILALSFASFGSTCHGQSAAGGGDTAKDTPTSSDVTLPGVDTSMLTPREKREWSQYVSTLLAPCSDVPVSIAQCVQDKRSCSKCAPAAKYVLRGVRDGLSQEQVEKSYKNRFDPEKIKNVPIDGSSSKGPEAGPLTLIEFADFECPFCAMEAPILEKSWQSHKSQLRYVYKYFPISAHPHGESSARAAIAAGSQGKFWEMHDALFANRDHLEPSDVDGYAKEMGLDLVKFHADEQSKDTTDRIERDKKLASDVGVQGTPTIFINGREYDPHQDLDEWLALELQGIESSATPAAPGANAKDAGAVATAPKK